MDPRKTANRGYFFLALCLCLLAVAALRHAWFAFRLGRPPPVPSASREERAAIYDRKGRPLAVSLERWHVYLNTRKILDAKASAATCEALGMEPTELAAYAAEPRTHLVRRFADRATAERVRRAHVDALLLERVWQRSYPQGSLLAHTLGYTGFDGSGLFGLEYEYNATLSGKGSASNRGELLLSIDSELQYAAERALERGVREHEAEGGCLLIQDPRNGRLLTLAASPGFDPNRIDRSAKSPWQNPAVAVPIEPGSIFKVFFIGALLERFTIDFDKPYFYADRQYLLENGEVIQDARAYGWVNFRDIVKYSINGGIIQACHGLSWKDRYEFLVKARFGALTGIDLPGEHKGNLPPTRAWGVRTAATVLIGQGLEVTPVQLISSFSAVVNGGVWFRPRVVDRIAWRDERGMHTQAQPIQPEARLLGADASRKTLSLLSWGTVPGSTGELARSTGYTNLGGKTATSQLVDFGRRGYASNRYNALFIGAFPDQNPRASVLVLLNTPKRGHTGGLAAAPLFAELLPDLVRILELPLPREAVELRNRLLTLSRPAVALSTRQLPDFTGLSVRDAQLSVAQWREQLAAEGRTLEVSFEGSGYVRHQLPAAGSPLSLSNLSLKLSLGPP